ncbi:MAG: NAD(P)H-hydrate epimerase [Acidimicrobiia bacterium]|nr:NAD(P)H-hydrate epimerase [Acidimicrobiia bacterium]
MLFPSVTRAQMEEADRIMVEDLGVSLLQMMELAGAAVAHVAGLVAPRSALVLAGSGGNGGGALAAGRHLAHRGVEVTVVRSSEARRPETARQWDVLSRIGARGLADPKEADVVIDGVLGYSRSGPPRGRAGELIGWMNEASAPIVSVDLPSGLDPDTGAGPSVVAASVVTLALPKPGLRGVEADLWLADIGIPPVVWERLGVDVPSDPFEGARVVPIRRTDAGWLSG